ncbi:MAG TPA: S1/P1 nuclease, partial [Pyrinomonadaceae bacterium]|nr:S1/P1 nuclease [Pyrinomonadaceae bacterium]
MFRKIKALAVIAGLLLSFAMPSFAWDEVGHKITAYIAWQQMTPDVRARVIKTLLAAPEDAQLSTFYASYGSRTQEARQREFFMLIATWPDIIRDKNFPVRQKNYAHSDWHYADTFWQWKDNKVELLPEAEASGHALEKLADFDKLIRSNATDAEKAVAIAWLEHLIGDIHQPLHASSRVTSSNAKGDQGGNLFLLTPKGTPRDKQENLHWFWDSIVVRYQPNSKDVCDADYIDPIANEMMKLYPYDKLKG